MHPGFMLLVSLGGLINISTPFSSNSLPIKLKNMRWLNKKNWAAFSFLLQNANLNLSGYPIVTHIDMSRSMEAEGTFVSLPDCRAWPEENGI